MPHYDDNLNQLSAHIDTLAAELVLGHPLSEPVSAALQALYEHAGQCGREDIRSLTEDLMQSIERGRSSGSEDLEQLAEALQSGVELLQDRIGTLAAGIPAEPSGTPEEHVPPAEKPKTLSAPLPTHLGDDPELVADFLLEAREHLSSVETLLLAVEQDPGNVEAIHAIFRGFHTIKGLAGFLELGIIQEIAHETETLLDLARTAQISITSAVIDVVLHSADYIRKWLSSIDDKQCGRAVRFPEADAILLNRIRSLSVGGSDSAPAQPVSASAEAPPADRADEPPASSGPPVVPASSMHPAAKPPAQNSRRTENPAASRSVKVETSKLDYLVDMVGEMVIAQSLIRHDPGLGSVQNPRLYRNLSQLARITAEVQKVAMAMRMVPVGQLFQRTARLVRDLSQKAGKRVELIVSGEETELDRTLVEELADPLMHMVRNAIDHGLETPEQRIEAGKDPVGKLTLRAWHQAGHIVIEIGDDGRGLDRHKILTKAKERGLIEHMTELSDQDVFAFIFQPGFSTAAQVTDISGRGVGMDVVKKQLQKLRGRVETSSILKQGTRFALKLPLTLAIIDGLVVVTGEERYIVPLFSVRELLRPSEGMVSTVHERGEMALVRGELLPIIRLHRRFGVKPRSEDPAQCVLVVTDGGGKPFCLMVDDIIGKQEVVIKGLGEMVKNIPGIAGGAILGDGRVGLILDMEGTRNEA